MMNDANSSDARAFAPRVTVSPGCTVRSRQYLERPLLWSRASLTASCLGSSLWIVPFNAMPLALPFAPLPRVLDARLGVRRLHREEIADAEGRRRVVYRTPDRDDFVNVAFNEIRTCGAGNVQVARRLRAMLDNLRMALPKHRRLALDGERSQLDTMLEKLYPIPDDLALARIADSQGLGGSTAARMSHWP